MRKTISGGFCSAALVLAFNSHAALQGRINVEGVCLAYFDDVLNVTWAADAGASGPVSHAQALAWAASLSIGGVTGWRLPNANPVNGATFAGNFKPNGTSDQGYNIHASGTATVDPTASELAHLYHNTLSNQSGLDLTNRERVCFNAGGAFCLQDPGPFMNVQPASYWTGTQNPDHPPNSQYVTFLFDIGRQTTLRQEADQQIFAWAVQNGDVGSPCTVGEPAPDDDGDGVPNALDNCTLVPNGPLALDSGGNSQFNTDGDIYGNACDTDLTNDLVTNGLDVGPFVQQFGTSGPDADFNGDGVVNGLDVGPFVNRFGTAPGPSGLQP